MASSDIIKIGFDYRSSLAQFEKDTNGVFDGISSKAGKQKITIQLDAKDDKVIDKIKELQKLKLDKFTFEFGNSGLKEQLQTFDKLENKINEIINLSKGIGNSSAPIVDVNKSSKEIDKLENKISELNKKYDELQKKSATGGISGKEVNLVDNDEFKKLSQEVSELKDQFDDLKTHMSLLDDYTVPTDRFFELQTQVEATSVKVSNLVDEMTRLSNVQKNIGVETNISSGMKDAFPDKDVSASVETATNSIKEENNVLEQNTQKAKENAEAKEKIVNADKEVSNVDLSKYDTRLQSYTKKTSGYDATIARFENGGWTSDDYKKRVDAVKEAVKQYEDILNNLKKHPELVTEEELGKLDKQEKLIKENITAVQNMSAAEKGYSLISAQKELDKINNILKEHSGMSREAKNQIKAYYAEIKSGNPSASLDVIHGKIMQIVNAEIEAGRGGKSMWSVIKEKAWYGVAGAIGTYFGFNDFIRYGKEGVSIVRQLDTALTEMRKVSNESVQSLKRYQDTTFDTADAVGTTAKQIQNSTADWMRLGESMDQAAKSAKDANILLNVSEFEGIDEATDSLVSMSQAYKDLNKMDIIDVLNNIGNNYSISTDGLATALKDSASALVTANNDLNEAVSLTTAGNAITQDPSKVGAGLRTISLRLVGTTQAKQELEDLGEETDGMITTASKLRDTIQSATSAATKDGKGLDIFDSNGNYKSTYEIMQGLADLYDEIVKKDKELGTNNLNLLLETIAGKNRSNIAASILQNGDMLRSVYEDAQNSKGSAENELNAYLDSVDGKFQQLQNRAQEFWYNVIDTTTVKSVLDFTTDLTEGASKFFKLVEKHLPTILGAIATIIASNKSGGLIRLINFINNSPFLATVEFNREVCELIV
jgi:TP901 family phage tail tape measure protein|nr:MAG TPA_asm: minor tail protein [Caudoviricetes sp.]